MLIETCGQWRDKYIDINNAPDKAWEDLIKSDLQMLLEEKLKKPISSYNVTVHFCPRREIPIPIDRRKVGGYYDSMGNNSCMIYVYNKISAMNMGYLMNKIAKYIIKDFTDTTLHYDHEGNPCHCKREED